MGFEHGVESVQEFAHDGDQGLHFEFALGEQMLIEGAQVRVVLDGDQGGHEESMTQVFITCVANTLLIMHGGRLAQTSFFEVCDLPRGPF